MTNKQVWLITGAGRGMGLYITKAALAAGATLSLQAEILTRYPRPSENPQTCWL